MRRGTCRALAAPTAAAGRGRVGARGAPACPCLPSGRGRPPGTDTRGSDPPGTGLGRGAGSSGSTTDPRCQPWHIQLAKLPAPTPTPARRCPPVPGGTRTPRRAPQYQHGQPTRRQRRDPVTPGHSPATPVPCRPAAPGTHLCPGSARSGPAPPAASAGRERGGPAGRGGAGPGARTGTRTRVCEHTLTSGHAGTSHMYTHTQRRTLTAPHTHTHTHTPAATPVARGDTHGDTRGPRCRAHAWLSPRAVLGLSPRRDRHLLARAWGRAGGCRGRTGGTGGRSRAPLSCSPDVWPGPSPEQTKFLCCLPFSSCRCQE